MILGKQIRQMRRFRVWIWLSVASLAQFGSFASAQAPIATPVTYRFVGDDGLSQRLYDAIRKSIAQDPELRLSTVEDSSTLVLETESNIDWDELDGREVAIYRVLASYGEAHRVPFLGVCFASHLSKCADDVVARAKRLIRP